MNTFSFQTPLKTITEEARCISFEKDKREIEKIRKRLSDGEWVATPIFGSDLAYYLIYLPIEALNKALMEPKFLICCFSCVSNE